MRLILFGPPGAGKGTQAARLAVRLDVPAISTGEIFRGEVSRGTELGTLAKSYMDAGKYVPDEVVNGIVWRLGGEVMRRPIDEIRREIEQADRARSAAEREARRVMSETPET